MTSSSQTEIQNDLQTKAPSGCTDDAEWNLLPEASSTAFFARFQITLPGNVDLANMLLMVAMNIVAKIKTGWNQIFLFIIAIIPKYQPGSLLS